jgi:hypothetical protein
MAKPKLSYFEPRWPVALAILAVILLLVVLPDRIRLFPMWVTYVLGFGVLVPIAAIGLMSTPERRCIGGPE